MKKCISCLSLVFVFLSFSQPVDAQIFRRKNKSKTEKSKKNESADKYEQKIKNAEKIEGLFTMYRDKNRISSIVQAHADRVIGFMLIGG